MQSIRKKDKKKESFSHCSGNCLVLGRIRKAHAINFRGCGRVPRLLSESPCYLPREKFFPTSCLLHPFPAHQKRSRILMFLLHSFSPFYLCLSDLILYGSYLKGKLIAHLKLLSTSQLQSMYRFEFSP
jgi:hypothetical protein